MRSDLSLVWRVGAAASLLPGSGARAIVDETSHKECCPEILGARCHRQGMAVAQQLFCELWSESVEIFDPKQLEREIKQAKALSAGAENYRAYVGPPAQFDFMGATQFTLLFLLGLREEHSVLDVGCGSLRAGRLLLQFLLPGRHVGIEPNSWLWRDAVSKEIGDDIIRIKVPQFVGDDTFSLTKIDRQFEFVVFQSILSRTGGDLFDRALEEARKVLLPGGQLLFTVLDDRSAS